MHWMSKWALAAAVCGAGVATLAAQDCPARPDTGTVVNDPLSLTSTNGVLSAQFTLARSVDDTGYTHYCYKYNTATGVAEAPTLRVNPGDKLNLKIVNRVKDADEMSGMDMAGAATAACGDSGATTVSSTNVHFHGMYIPPKCHQDDVINTLIQPGSAGFQYNLQIPTTEPPGLYWYHPHIHGFTEFQVNGGAAGALIVGGMEKFRPEVSGLTERVFVIRQQYLVPWIPGPYELTINYQVAPQLLGGKPIIEMKPGEKQFWRIANATLQDFLELQFVVNGKPMPMEIIALDGYPLAQTRNETEILVPPAGRAEFIVQAPAAGAQANFITQQYATGPTGNADLQQTLAQIRLTNNSNSAQMPKGTPTAAPEELKYADLSRQPVTAQRKLFFSEEFGGTNGPIQFYITVYGQRQKVFQPDEDPVIKTKIGAVEDWTIENRALETHAFHIHQIHFQVLEVDGKPVADKDLRDTIEIPFWSGTGPFHSVKVRMDFRDPTIAGTFLFHCHILLHEDLGMMHKIQVDP